MKKELIQESAKMQKLAGIITESQYKKLLKEEQGNPKEIEDFLDDMINMSVPEDSEEGETVEGVWEVSEYGDEDAYGEAANEFKAAHEYIKSKGGKITVEGSPDVIYTALPNGDIKYKLIVTLDEMARTAGTGGAFTITKEGEDVLRQVKATREIPEGLRSSMIAILIWLFKAKKEGKRVQKKTYADERGVPQPAVNPLFNKLLEKGLVSMEGYTPKGSASPGTKSNVSPEELDGLELDEVLDRIIERTE